MAAALVDAFVAAKFRAPAESRALYAVAGERGGVALVTRMQARMAAAVTALLASASDARFENPAVTALMVMGAIAGPVRLLLDGQAVPGFEAHLPGQLTRLVTAYLATHAVAA
ncbi:hypothetical protein [Ancylobacter terrae]|uniref:hypothetical protein n=1 Tax=Ancylobacter sp. sgz301288 TaxID=3342077 RepID=UPI00385D4356